MTDAVETMAWTGEVPWHGLGVQVGNDLSPEQMLVKAGLDWQVEKRPLFVKKGDGKLITVKERFGLTRVTDDSVLTIAGPTYKPVQNDIAADFFKKFVDEGKMTMETMGSLWGGRYVWVLARLGKGTDFALGKGSNADEQRGYLLLMQPHVRGKAMVMQTTGIRVVCWNTLNIALGANLKGSKNAFRMPHTMVFDEVVKAKAAEAVGLATQQMVEFKEAATLLSKKKAKPEEVELFFCELLQFDPKVAEKKKKDSEVKEPRLLPKFRQALEFSPGATLPSAAGTWWGAFNAVTAVVDHQLGRERSTALKSAWVGGNAALKRDALQLALKNAA